MRVLLVFHGWLPRDDRPVSGGALRAHYHREALLAAGHEVLLVTRAQDRLPGGPPTFDSPSALRRYAEAVRPDRILCVQAEEAPALQGVAPLCVDLFAPRLLEAAWEATQSEEAVRTLRAVAAADFHLFSNPRQRWFYLGLMALAGVDLRSDSGAVVPLVAPAGPRRRRPAEPLLVMGGVSWPWQDPAAALATTAEHLERRGRGRVVVYGGRPAVGETAVVDLPAQVPAGPRLSYAPSMPYAELLKTYARATAALDVMAPNAEREVALAFRHMDYLGCGLPIITGRAHALAPALQAAGAGWLVADDLSDLPAALDAVLDDPDAVTARGRAARGLARSAFSLAGERPLLDWIERGGERRRHPAPLPQAAALAAGLAEARAQGVAAAAALERAAAEVQEKREELAARDAQINQLIGGISRLSGAVDEIAGARSEAVDALRAELADLRDHLGKKSTELAELSGELRRVHDQSGRHKSDADRLAHELEAARAELSRLRERRLPWSR